MQPPTQVNVAGTPTMAKPNARQRDAATGVCAGRPPLLPAAGLLLLAVLAAPALAVQPQGADNGARPVTGVALSPGSQGLTSSAADRTSLHLSLYQEGFSAIHEQRSVALLSGRNDVLLTGLPDQLRLDSLSLDLPEDVSAGPVSLQPGIGEGTALRRRFIGERVEIAPAEPDPDAPTRSGRLLSVDGDRVTVALGAHIEQAGPGTPWRLLLPARGLPHFGASTRLFAENGGNQRLTLDYLSDGLGWRADHTLTLDDDATLRSHATLSNDTDATFSDPVIDLIAGEVADEGGPRPMAMMESRADGAAPEPAGDWYRYRLPAVERLPAGQQLRVALDRAQTVTTRRELLVVGDGGGQRRGTLRVPATIRLSVEERGDRPLPAGPVRVYDRGGDSPTYLGSDRIGHRPPREGFELTLGTAFDLAAERTQTEFERLGERRYEVAWRIDLRNAGDTAETVRLEERLPGDWQLTEGEGDWTRSDAGTLSRELRLDPGESRTVTYAARITQ